MSTGELMTEEHAALVVAYLNRAGCLPAMTGQAAVWRDALWGVRYVDAVEACRELARAADRVAYVKPGDVLREVRKLRAGRRGNRVPPAPPVELSAEDDGRFQRAYLRALGDGATEAQADAVACRALGVERGALPPANPGRLRELLAGSLPAVPEGD